MAKKKKPKPFRAVTAVKALARERIGVPKTEMVIPNKRLKAKTAEKHKRTLGELLNDES